jgi:hypothetical protein
MSITEVENLVGPLPSSEVLRRAAADFALKADELSELAKIAQRREREAAKRIEKAKGGRAC